MSIYLLLLVSIIKAEDYLSGYGVFTEEAASRWTMNQTNSALSATISD